MLISSGGLGAEVTPALRAATLPGADEVVAGLSAIPAGLTQYGMLDPGPGSWAARTGECSQTSYAVCPTSNNGRRSFRPPARSSTGVDGWPAGRPVNWAC